MSQAKGSGAFGAMIVPLRRTDKMVFDEQAVAMGGNSGFQAVNLAVMFGARRIALVGFDMHADHGVHWHGRHPAGMNNPTRNKLSRWRSVLDAAAADLADHGVKVINASPFSALEAYPKMSLGDAIECLSATNTGV